MPYIHLRDLYMLMVIGVIESVRVSRSARVRSALARALGSIAYRVSRQKRRPVELHLTCAFGAGLSAARKKAIAQQSFVEFWDEMLFWSYTTLPPSLAGRVQFCGVEHLEKALARGKGAILWESNGLGKRLLSKQILHAHGFDVVQVHALGHIGGIGGSGGASWVSSHIVKRYFDARLQRFVRRIIYLSGAETLTVTRELMQCLQDNEIICIAVEGQRGQKKIALPFLGATREFATGTANFARMSGAPLLPLFCLPACGGGYVLEIGKPIEPDDHLAREDWVRAALAAFVKELDARIRAHPEWYRYWDLLGTPHRRGANGTD